MIRRMFVAALVAAWLAGCTWVELTPEGEQVQVATAEGVKGCKQVGKTVVSLRDKVAGMARHPDQVQEELNTLARNSAVDLGGNRVVPLAPPADGRQTFAVYRCD